MAKRKSDLGEHSDDRMVVTLDGVYEEPRKGESGRDELRRELRQRDIASETSDRVDVCMGWNI